MAGPWITEHEIKIVEEAMRNGWYWKAYSTSEYFQPGVREYHNRKHGIRPRITEPQFIFFC